MNRAMAHWHADLDGPCIHDTDVRWQDLLPNRARRQALTRVELALFAVFVICMAAVAWAVALNAA